MHPPVVQMREPELQTQVTPIVRRAMELERSAHRKNNTVLAAHCKRLQNSTTNRLKAVKDTRRRKRPTLEKEGSDSKSSIEVLLEYARTVENVNVPTERTTSDVPKNKNKKCSSGKRNVHNISPCINAKEPKQTSPDKNNKKGNDNYGARSKVVGSNTTLDSIHTRSRRKKRFPSNKPSSLPIKPTTQSHMRTRKDKPKKKVRSPRMKSSSMCTCSHTSSSSSSSSSSTESGEEDLSSIVTNDEQKNISGLAIREHFLKLAIMGYEFRDGKFIYHDHSDCSEWDVTAPLYTIIEEDTTETTEEGSANDDVVADTTPDSTNANGEIFELMPLPTTEGLLLVDENHPPLSFDTPPSVIEVHVIDHNQTMGGVESLGDTSRAKPKPKQVNINGHLDLSTCDTIWKRILCA